MIRRRAAATVLLLVWAAALPGDVVAQTTQVCYNSGHGTAACSSSAVPYATATGGANVGPALGGLGWLTPGQALLTLDFTMLNVTRDGTLDRIIGNSLVPIVGGQTVVVRARINHLHGGFSPTSLSCTLDVAHQECSGFGNVPVFVNDQISISGFWNTLAGPGVTATVELSN